MNKEDVFKFIVSHTCEVIPELEDHSFQPGDSLKQLGANSIDRAEIIMMTLEALSLQIPLVDMAGAKNIGNLSEIIYSKI